MEIVCKHCENIQEAVEKITARKVTYKKIDGVPSYKIAGQDWLPEPLNICNKCNQLIEKDFDPSRISFISTEVSDPSHARYWQRGKSNSEIASVIADEKDPY